MFIYPITKLYLICSFVSIGSLAYGYNSGALIAVNVLDKRDSGYQNTKVEDNVLLVVPLALSCLGALCSGLVADFIGRKRSFGVAAMLDLIGSLIQLLARKYWEFLLGRLIASFSVGGRYLKSNARLITLHQLGITLGFSVAFWIGYALHKYTFDKAWRISIGLQIVPAVVLLAGLLFIPESPRWLLCHDRKDEGFGILTDLRCAKDEPIKDTVRMEYTRILENVGYDRQCDAQGVGGLWSKGIENNARRTLLGTSIQSASQLSGISALQTYLPQLAGPVLGTKRVSALLFLSIGSTISLIFTILVDRLNRRKILICGGLGMGVCMIVIVIITGLQTEITDKNTDSESLGALLGFNMSSINRKPSIAIVSLIFGFMAIHSASFGTLAWVYPAEIYTQLIRAKAIGITVAANFCVQIFIVEIAPLMFLNILWGTYIIFGCLCFLISILIYYYYPETKGRSLEEIHLIFSGALFNQRAEAHHPSTAAETLFQMAKISIEESESEFESKEKDKPRSISDLESTSESLMPPICGLSRRKTAPAVMLTRFPDSALLRTKNLRRQQNININNNNNSKEESSLSIRSNPIRRTRKISPYLSIDIP
ncbi:hypothetical protein PHYBLDRAFT_175027 [Phycomyces blakesleeanus NRRL 1555(-)]|uniref:Major facilitator superfamily (MFS) profile domain-containing protein n=1 Tax=Phycomyces blakesleeanus (strain ATCC 8743b / DSM 1359 / FGSC 10004 / NBRC 33097 / NRRL 1555) TaxID=763407 RepID=A0A162TFJ3_PHYB8|nr:hypothetical protein PHYBLDRAFT_175027 [Phycomyces blakesleeanus NRRL 1555(-)]OAD66733.1 hypothetical protein PHYBLDRAFT_175027 [Phycomyces blakesleeanus NRRL 1555(-)]|eukprot:XP_018284773.1 hypothetical protein PHYBLDRAFT_175027 [Phycomyces blakesleeanus NRRL 1555(-)]